MFAELVVPTAIVAPKNLIFPGGGGSRWKIGGGGGGRNKAPSVLSSEKLVTLGYYFGKYGIFHYDDELWQNDDP